MHDIIGLLIGRINNVRQRNFPFIQSWNGFITIPRPIYIHEVHLKPLKDFDYPCVIHMARQIEVGSNATTIRLA
jgi:hypothetical protein